ncbi:MAG: ATP-binding protein [Bacteroidales bacterium]|nr:ATP-binding protein [Bacteroidales bacterium]
MLVQFSFSNYKSFKDKVTLNLKASTSKADEARACASGFGYSVLKAVAVYGANASGKTKLFDALKFMKMVVCPPQTDNLPMFDYWKHLYSPFRLSSSSAASPSLFEVVFIMDGEQFKYGFELNKDVILKEWLLRKTQRWTTLFTREGNDITCAKANINERIAKTLIDAHMVSSSTTFLGALAAFNEPLANRLRAWFSSVVIVSANDMGLSVSALQNEEWKSSMLSFVKMFDIGIEDLMPHEIGVEQIPDKIKAILGLDRLKGQVYDGIIARHRVYNDLYERDGSVWFSMEQEESFGTNRLMLLSHPIVNALRNNTVLLVDEIDSGIHTLVLKSIIETFYRKSKSAQIVFNTHCTPLLGMDSSTAGRLLNKDQVYFVNKNMYGESSLTAMQEYEGNLRSNLERKYLDGYLEGVPAIDEDAINLREVAQ